MTATDHSTREATAVLAILSVFAMCVENARPRLVTSRWSEYYLVAKRARRGGRYTVRIWRTRPLDDPEWTLFTLSRFPGVVGASHAACLLYPVPLDDLARNVEYMEVWGVAGCFTEPVDHEELNALREWARV